MVGSVQQGPGTEGAVTDVLIDLARLDNGPQSKDLALSVVAGLKETLGQVNAKPYREVSVLIKQFFVSTFDHL